MAITKVEYESTIPAGTNIIVLWPVGTPLPSQATLHKVAAQYGEPFTLAYLSYNHEGVAIGAPVYALDVYKAFAAAAGGNAPFIAALDPSDDQMVDIELKAKMFKDQIGKLSSGAIDLITPPLLPDSGLVRGLIYVAVGVVILGGGYYLYSKFRGRRSSRRGRR